ncbi:hypothetical protein EV361DRAFT_237061 [Lentinula raphanica]|nr:hypothetical protein EV361DRAFT_237061 [Lentinula raphanica]
MPRSITMLIETETPYQLLDLNVAGPPLPQRISKTRSPDLHNDSEYKIILMKADCVKPVLSKNFTEILSPVDGTLGKPRSKAGVKHQSMTPFTVRLSASSYPYCCAVAQSALCGARKDRARVSCSGHIMIRISCVRLLLSSSFPPPFCSNQGRSSWTSFFLTIPLGLHVTFYLSFVPFLVSTGRRSTSPPITEQRIVDDAPISNASRKRRTRFGTPPDVAISSDRDDWVPDEFKVETPADDARPQEITTGTTQPTDPVHDTQPLPRRQRAPLPPQSARFREVSRNHPASSSGGIHEAVLQEQPQTQPSPPVIRSQPLTLERDRPPHQRSSKFGPPLTNDSTPSSASRDRSPSVRYPQPGQGASDPADGSSSRAHINEDTMNGQLPKAPRAMGRDDTAPTAPRSSTVRERSPRGPDRETRELGLAHHPERTWKDELMASQLQVRGRGPRGRPPPHLSGTNNVPMGSRIGADGIPNGPARASNNAPRVPLSSANLIPVTNNRYADSNKMPEEVRSPTVRSGGTTMRPTPATYDRDPPVNRGRPDAFEVAGATTVPSRPRSNSPHTRYKEASPPPSSREVTTSPSWERDSERGGRSASGKSLESAERFADYVSRGGPDDHELDRRGQRQTGPTANGFTPSPMLSSSIPPLPRNLPAKPVQQPPPELNRSRGLRVSPQRHWRPPSPEARPPPRRDPTPPRDRPLPKRLSSPVEPRAQRREPSPPRWSQPRRSITPPAPHDQRRAPSPPPNRTPRRRTISPEERAPRRHADVYIPSPPTRNEDRRPLDYPQKPVNHPHRAPADMDVDEPPPHHHNDNGHRDQKANNLPERPPVNRRGGSLLDRLSMSASEQVPPLRDRVQIPAKRDREDLMRDGGAYSVDVDMDDEVVGKRRKRGGKQRRGRGRGSGAYA